MSIEHLRLKYSGGPGNANSLLSLGGGVGELIQSQSVTGTLPSGFTVWNCYGNADGDGTLVHTKAAPAVAQVAAIRLVGSPASTTEFYDHTGTEGAAVTRTVIINEIPYTYTDYSYDGINLKLQKLSNAITAPGISKNVLGNSLILTSTTPGTPFTISVSPAWTAAGQTNKTILYTNLGYFALVKVNGTLNSDGDYSNVGNCVAGVTFSITLNGTPYSIVSTAASAATNATNLMNAVTQAGFTKSIVNVNTIKLESSSPFTISVSPLVVVNASNAMSMAGTSNKLSLWYAMQNRVALPNSTLSWKNGLPVNANTTGTFSLPSPENGMLVVEMNAIPATNTSATLTTSQLKNTLFDDISGGESLSGMSDYRAIYLANGDTVTHSGINMWVDQPTSGYVTLQLGLAVEGVNGSVASISTEITTPNAVTFITPTEASPLSLPDLAPNARIGVWVKRTISPGVRPAFPSDNSTIKYSAV